MREAGQDNLIYRGVDHVKELGGGGIAVAGDAGCLSCHTHMSCTERCPKQLSPTAGIAGLKREVSLAWLKNAL